MTLEDNVKMYCSNCNTYVDATLLIFECGDGEDYEYDETYTCDECDKFL